MDNQDETVALSIYNKSKHSYEPEMDKLPLSDATVLLEKDEKGFIYYKEMNSMQALIVGLYVLPAYQNEGIATELLEQLKSKYKWLLICVDSRNTVATELYKKHGLFIKTHCPFTGTISTETKGG